MTFNSFLAVTTIPMELAVGCGLGLPPVVVMILIMILYLVSAHSSMRYQWSANHPVFYPLIVALGYDPIWFGIMIVMVVEMGMISPPVGMTIYVIKALPRTFHREDIPRRCPIPDCGGHLRD
jgi:TRAP-type C4-dicarboxylate transport system permease large subunit